MVKKSPDRGLQLRAPVPPIVMGARTSNARSRTETTLTLLVRAIALVWMIEGVQQWMGVLTMRGIVYLPGASPLHIAALFFFCVLDFVAAVGLWLVASWGVAVWCATMFGHGLALAIAPDFFVDPVLLIAGDAVLGAAYGLLAWAMLRERRAR